MPQPSAIDPNQALASYNDQMAQKNAMLNGLFSGQLPGLPNSLPADLTGKPMSAPSWLDILQARGAQLGTDQVDPGITYGGLK